MASAPNRRIRRAPAVAAAASLVTLASCGRPAPEGAITEIQGDPDIAGVSVTSPGAVVEPQPTAPGDTPSTTTTTTSAGSQAVYVVQPGDTLSVIASRYGVTVDALARANGITNVNAIAPGQELIVPALQPDPASQPPGGDASNGAADAESVEVEVSVVEATPTSAP